MNKLLIFSDWFPPAFKAGGPINSVFNLVNLIKDSFEVFVLTSAYDHGDQNILENIDCDKWLINAGVKVFYSTKGSNVSKEAQRIIQAEDISNIYFNSMFSVPFALRPFLSLRKFDVKIVWSPRGMLKASAISNKSIRKKSFLLLLRILHLTNNIHFVASDEQESKDIKYWFGANTIISTIPNVPKISDSYKVITKNTNKTKICFIGRIHPIKNLDFALSCLNEFAESDYEFSIIGPIEDKGYYELCRHILGDRKNTHFLGPITPLMVKEELMKSHFLFLPTKGENFGHAIFESLMAGRPVLISNQTPWKNLFNSEIGFDLDLDSKESFYKALKFFFELNQNKFDEYCKNAFIFAQNFVDNQKLKKKYLQVFKHNSL